MVYFIYSQDANRIRIGYSKSILGCVAALRRAREGNRDRLCLLSIIPGGAKRLEELCGIFKGECITGKWFLASLEILSLAKREMIPEFIARKTQKEVRGIKSLKGLELHSQMHSKNQLREEQKYAEKYKRSIGLATSGGV